MALVRWERPLLRWPWPDDGIDRALREMSRDWFGECPRAGGAWPVHVEEYIEDGTCVIRAELPGIDPDKDVQVEIADGMVHVTARREERSKNERPDGYRSEFRYGSFERFVAFPEGATEADVKASYRDGILEVRLPMPTPAAKAEPARVAVDRS